MKHHTLKLLSLLALLFYLLPAGAQVKRNVAAMDTATLTAMLDSVWLETVNAPDSGLVELAQYEARSRALGFSYGLGKTRMYQALLLNRMSHYDTAIGLLAAAMTEFDRTVRGQEEMPRLLSQTGNIYLSKGAYEKGLKFQLKALDIAARDYPDRNVDYIYSNVAAILATIGRPPATIRHYLEQAEQMAFRYRNFYLMSTLENNKGTSYAQTGQYDSSLLCFRRAVMFSRSSCRIDNECVALINIGDYFLKTGAPDSALHYLYEAREKAAYLSMAARERLNISLALAYMEMGWPQKARPLVLQSYQNALDKKDSVALREAYRDLSRLYADLNDFKKGYQFAWDYIVLDHKLEGRATVDNINQLELDYRTAEKEKELISKRLMIARQEKALASRNTWLAIFIGGVAGLCLLLLLFRSRYRSRQKLLQARLHDMEQIAQIENLKATIQGEAQERIRIARELHDGLGAMTSAARINLGLLKHQDAASAQVVQSTAQLLDEISADLRFTAHNMMPQALMEKDLPKAVATFCEYVGRNKPFTITLQTFGAFERLPQFYLLGIYRIIQELVHNAEKHAGASTILVQLSYTDDLLSVTVEDDGRGFDLGAVPSRKGLGLDSIRSRVKSLGGSLTVDTAPGKGTSVVIDIHTKGA